MTVSESRAPLAVLLIPTLLAPAQAELVDAAAEGFTSRHRVEIAAERTRVYEVFVGSPNAWWNPQYTVSGDAGALSIDARPMGCFCESFGGNAGLVHMTVTFVNPGVMLRLTGGLGPLGLLGVAGNMTVEFEDREGGSAVVLQYAVGGYHPQGLDTLAADVDAALGEQLLRLSRYIESGAPAGGR